MVAKWKGKKLKHSVILKKLNDLKKVNEDGTISWKGFEYFSATLALQNMIEFPEKVNDFYKGNIVQQALDNILKKYLTLHEQEFMNEINSIIKKASKTEFIQFYVLSSMSLGGHNLIKNLNIEDCKISFFDANYPEKFKNRKEFIEVQHRKADKTPLGYKKVVVSLKAKSGIIAITTALRALDLQRAVWCLLNQSFMEVPDNEWEPINKIRLGHIHTVHDENGQCETELLWYEPNFIEAKLFTPSDSSKFIKNSEWLFLQLGKLSYSDTMKNALLRYVRALDEADQNVALIKLWGALEELTTDSNYDSVTRRISFLFNEREYHQQILESLRDYRNSTVHAGEQSIHAKAYSRTLQYYFCQLILFHLKSAGEFQDLKEANTFLDLSTDENILNRRKKLIEKAIEFRSQY